METVNISLFGSVRIIKDGVPFVTFRTHKVAALLILLAAEPAEHRREALMDLLWPGMPEASARSNLRQILFHLRQAIPDFSLSGRAVPLLIANRNSIRLNPEAPVQVDIRQFFALQDEIKTHAHLSLLTCPDCRTRMQAAAALYQGHFLADFYLDDSTEFENWAENRRQACRRRMLDLLETLTAAALREQDFTNARALAERQLEIDDLHESAYQQLMETLARSGRRNEAVSVYEQCRRILQEELGMLPSARTTRLYEQISAGELRLDAPAAPQGLRGYTLMEEIGSGAFGVIFRAVQPPMGRDVAVKVIRRQYANDPVFIRRFEVEAQTIAHLEHPHIVPLYDYWRDPEGAFLVMRLLRGGSLLQALAQGAWPTERTLGLLDQIAPALAAAHAKGIIHRDIKPANILFDETGNAYLSDFGIARNLLVDRELTLEGGLVGTPDYISPEQLLGEEVGPPSDIYSLGAVLYEMLTGEKPFQGQPLARVIQSHLAAKFPRVRDSLPEMPPEIDEVIGQATAKRPGDRFPDMAALAEAFRRAVRGPAAARPGAASLPADLQNPYKGLRAFQRIDAADFFGREALTAQLVERLAESRFLAVVGPSGSGKSSVVRAGVIPSLQGGAIPGSDRWFIAEMIPGRHPLEELEKALWPVAVDPPPDLVGPMSRDPHGLLRTIRRILPEEDGAQLLIVIDQFEELWSMAGQDARRQFIESLLTALHAPGSPLRVIATLRADFYDRPLQHQPLAALFKQNTALVLPLTREELTWAIQEPAGRLGVSFDDGVLAAIVADMQEQPGALPLLQYALTEMFEHRQHDRITQQSAAAAGGVPGALRRKAEEIYMGLDPAGREIARQVFLRLVLLGDSGGESAAGFTRRRALQAELADLENGRNDGRASPVSTVLERLGAARLVTFDHDPLTRRPTVEVAHEALLREWDRLRGWLAAAVEDVRMHRSLLAAREEWERAGRDPGYLLQGPRLVQFEAWTGAAALALTHAEQQFLAESAAARQAQEQAEAARRERELETARRLAETERERAEEQTRAVGQLRRRAVYLTGALAVAAVLAIFALVFAQRAAVNEQLALDQQSTAVAEAAQRATAQASAEQEQAEAEAQAQLAISRELAAAALISLRTDPERSILLALQAVAASRTQQAEEVLHQVVMQSRVRRTITVGSELWAAAFSPDGGTFAAGDQSGRLTLWDAGSGEPAGALEGHEGYVNAVAYSPDGKWIATAGDDNARLWDAVTGAELFRMPAHTHYVIGIDFSPDGRFLVTSSWDQTAIIWDVEASLRAGVGRELHVLAGHTDQLWKVSFSPDGREVATASLDGTARVWDVESGAERLVLDIGKSYATGVSVERALFSPDGKRIVVVGGTQNRAELSFWDRATGEMLYRLDEPKTVIQNARFSPDGTKLATAGLDGTAIVWDLTGYFPKELIRLSGHTSWVNDLAFSPDGKLLITASRDMTIRVWDLSPSGQQEVLSFAGVTGWRGALVYDPSGQVLVGGDDGGMLRAWDSAAGREIFSIRAHDDAITALAFHPDGTLLATASEDRSVQIRDAGTGRSLRTLGEHGPIKYEWQDYLGVMSLRFSPDGLRLASAGVDGQVIVWDPATGERLLSLQAHPEERAALAVAFNHDGSLLAAGTDQPSRITVWDAVTGEELASFTLGETRRIFSLAFSPVENILVFGNNLGALQGWRLPEDPAAFPGREPVQLFALDSAHAAAVAGIAISPDGRTLATAGTDQTLKVWELPTGRLLFSLGMPVVSAAFSPDGAQIAAAGVDGLVRVVYVQLEDLISLAKARLTRGWSTEECRQYLHLETCEGE